MPLQRKQCKVLKFFIAWFDRENVQANMGCILSGDQNNQGRNDTHGSNACTSVCCAQKVAPDKRIKITGCTFMDNGYLVTVDYNNRRIKLYDTELKCCSFINLDYRPYNVCAFKNSLYVTMPKKKCIQRLRVTCKMVCVRRKLLVRNRFPTEGECRGIVLYNTDLIVSVKYHTHANEITDSSWQIHILGMDGVVKRRIAHDSEGAALVHDAKYIALTPNNKELVISEAEDSSIKCLDLEKGELTFNHHMEDPKGVICDKSGNIYVLGKRGVIRWILADRESAKVLLKGTSGINYSECITYIKHLNTLAVPRNENRIELYKLKNSIHDG